MSITKEEIDEAFSHAKRGIECKSPNTLLSPDFIIRLIQYVRELKEENKAVYELLSNLQCSASNMYEVNSADIECRSDEDCDHCVWVYDDNQAKQALEKLTALMAELDGK